LRRQFFERAQPRLARLLRRWLQAFGFKAFGAGRSSSAGGFVLGLARDVAQQPTALDALDRAWTKAPAWILDRDHGQQRLARLGRGQHLGEGGVTHRLVLGIEAEVGERLLVVHRLEDARALAQRLGAQQALSDARQPLTRDALDRIVAALGHGLQSVWLDHAAGGGRPHARIGIAERELAEYALVIGTKLLDRAKPLLSVVVLPLRASEYQKTHV
jgi:hypothetical protein